MDTVKCLFGGGAMKTLACKDSACIWGLPFGSGMTHNYKSWDKWAKQAMPQVSPLLERPLALESMRATKVRQSSLVRRDPAIEQSTQRFYYKTCARTGWGPEV